MSSIASTSNALLPVVLTPGEPAGIGPDLALYVAARHPELPFIAVADPELLADRARTLGLTVNVELTEHSAPAAPEPDASRIRVMPVACAAQTVAGKLDSSNSAYVLETIKQAALGCLEGRFGALVTAPVHKGIINEAGIEFSGHTEFLAELAGVQRPVMMLASPTLRVALATTHLPLRAVSDAITPELLRDVVQILCHDLEQNFGISSPRILICGLNPHAGESGHLGTEEIDVIEPAASELRAKGLRVTGPIPADTAFTPRQLRDHDAVLAMYHDQGLPVLKALGFGDAVNVTLGLPFVRTSVDHGTALDLAGRGEADASSLVAALRMAFTLRAGTKRAPGPR